MDEIKLKKAKKKTSLSKQIKNLKAIIKKDNESYHRIWKSRQKLIEELDSIERILPKKYFKIKFKIKNIVNSIAEFEEIIKNYTLEMAIEELLKNKLHPETFELIDVKILG